MRIAAPEQVDQYLNKVLGVEAKLKALNTNLTHLKERAAELQVEREIQRVVPVANDEKTEEEREAWDREAGSRVKQYEEAILACKFNNTKYNPTDCTCSSRSHKSSLHDGAHSI